MTAPSRSRPGPVVGLVLAVEDIADAQNIRRASVDIGATRPLQIVFGGEHVIGAGEYVPVAPPGSWVPGLPGDRKKMVKMRRRTYRGVRSEGMLCSLSELGWARLDQQRQDAPVTRQHVVVLQPGLPVGTPLPSAGGWRHLVAHPDPRTLGPNTVELDQAEMDRLTSPTLEEDTVELDKAEIDRIRHATSGEDTLVLNKIVIHRRESPRPAPVQLIVLRRCRPK